MSYPHRSCTHPTCILGHLGKAGFRHRKHDQQHAIHTCTVSYGIAAGVAIVALVNTSVAFNAVLALCVGLVAVGAAKRHHIRAHIVHARHRFRFTLIAVLVAATVVLFQLDHPRTVVEFETLRARRARFQAVLSAHADVINVSHNDEYDREAAHTVIFSVPFANSKTVCNCDAIALRDTITISHAVALSITEPKSVNVKV